ncbi:MAG: hypothetical protein RL398_2890 [Planctomycetota bacterium]|jgi:hypothetical protein
MEKAIGEVVVPFLRDRGFKGSLPHFRRIGASRIDLISFQTYSSGGSFAVNLATCPADGVVHPWGKVVPPGKVTAYDVMPRRRLGGLGHGDYWFVYGKPNYESGHELVESPERYARVAEQVRLMLDQEGESYWASAAQHAAAADDRPQAGDRG